MTEEIEAHVLKKYEILQKLGNLGLNIDKARAHTASSGKLSTRELKKLLH